MTTTLNFIPAADLAVGDVIRIGRGSTFTVRAIGRHGRYVSLRFDGSTIEDHYTTDERVELVYRPGGSR